MRFELEQYGRLHDHTSYIGTGAESHYYRIYIHLYIQYVAKTADWTSVSRQGVCDRTLGKPLQSQPQNVLCTCTGVFPVVGAIRRITLVRECHR